MIDYELTLIIQDLLEPIRNLKVGKRTPNKIIDMKWGIAKKLLSYDDFSIKDIAELLSMKLSTIYKRRSLSE